MWVVVIATVVGSTVGACAGLAVLAVLHRHQAAQERTGNPGTPGPPQVAAPVAPGLPPRAGAGASARPEATKPLPVRPATGPLATPAPAPATLRAARPDPGPRPAPPPVPGPRRDPRAASAVTPAASPAASPAARSMLAGDEIALVSTSGLLFRVRSGAVLGRSRDCRVRLSDARVSRQHAVLYKARGSWWIGDLGSTNGTVVDGVPVRGAAPVGEGATVLVGGAGGVVLLALRAVDASPAGSPTAA